MPDVRLSWPVLALLTIGCVAHESDNVVYVDPNVNSVYGDNQNVLKRLSERAWSSQRR